MVELTSLGNHNSYRKPSIYRGSTRQLRARNQVRNLISNQTHHGAKIYVVAERPQGHRNLAGGRLRTFDHLLPRLYQLIEDIESDTVIRGKETRPYPTTCLAAPPPDAFRGTENRKNLRPGNWPGKH